MTRHLPIQIFDFAEAPMESRKPASVAGAAMCIASVLAMMFVAGSIGCSRESDLGFSKSTPATPEELLAELKTHQEKIDKATEGILLRINEFNQTRKPGERTLQFAEIFSQDFTDQQKAVLNQMIAEEKDVSYKSILQQIVSDRDTIQGLQDKLISERDQAVSQRDEAAAARDEAVRTVNDLQQVKAGLESDIAVLRQNKASLEASVERLSSDLAFRQNSLFYHAANVRELKDQGVLTSVLKRVQDVKPVSFDTALDLRQTNTITLAPAAFGLDRIVKVRMLPNIFQEGRDFKIETSEDSGVAKIVILDPDLFKGKEVLFAVGG